MIACTMVARRASRRPPVHFGAARFTMIVTTIGGRRASQRRMDHVVGCARHDGRVDTVTHSLELARTHKNTLASIDVGEMWAIWGLPVSTFRAIFDNFGHVLSH